MNYKIVELKNAQSYLTSIVEELGEKRAVKPSEESPTAWAMKAHIILDEVISEMGHEDICEQLNAEEPCAKCTNEKHDN